MRIPGTRPLRGAPHFTNYRRLSAYERATGLLFQGPHEKLVDWLLPAVCRTICTDCGFLGVVRDSEGWRICENCQGSVWLVSPKLRKQLVYWVGQRFPAALVDYRPSSKSGDIARSMEPLEVPEDQTRNTLWIVGNAFVMEPSVGGLILGEVGEVDVSSYRIEHLTEEQYDALAQEFCNEHGSRPDE